MVCGAGDGAAGGLPIPRPSPQGAASVSHTVIRCKLISISDMSCGIRRRNEGLRHKIAGGELVPIGTKT